MNILKKHLRDYLELRRGLGFELGRVESRLRSFVVFMKIKRARQITTKLAVEFALRSDRSVPTQAGYLSAIRGFAHYLSSIEPKTEVPPSGLIRRGHRPQPYIYSDDEIIRILNAAREHPSIPRYALKPHTLYCLFGYLSVTGMRLTEALNLSLRISIGKTVFLQSVGRSSRSHAWFRYTNQCSRSCEPISSVGIGSSPSGPGDAQLIESLFRRMEEP
jgi:integrase/recombinase XerD